MSFKLDNVQVGDILACTTSSEAAVEPGILIGKFLVVSKGSSEANNNKKDDNQVLTLHIMYRNSLGSPHGHKVGTNFNIPLEYLNHEVYSWNLDYRPEASK